jgi:hypothetical protein
MRREIKCILYIIYKLNQHPYLVEFRRMDTAEFRRDTVEFRRDTVEFRRVRTEFPRAAKNILRITEWGYVYVYKFLRG